MMLSCRVCRRATPGPDQHRRRTTAAPRTQYGWSSSSAAAPHLPAGALVPRFARQDGARNAAAPGVARNPANDSFYGVGFGQDTGVLLDMHTRRDEGGLAQPHP